MLDLDFTPRSVLVLGCGVVASELAQYLRRIGLPACHHRAAQAGISLKDPVPPNRPQVVQARLRAEGIELFTGAKIQSVSGGRRGVAVSFVHGGKKRVRRAAHLFNALGRHAMKTAGARPLASGRESRKSDADGQIVINRWQQTSARHIYAAGDCSGPVEIVHIAVQQGELAARHAAGAKGLKPIDYGLLLSVVFTDPPLATIGPLARDLKARGIPHLTASYPFNDHGKSILMEAPDGYVKVIAEPKRGRILGAEIVGADAGPN